MNRGSVEELRGRVRLQDMVAAYSGINDWLDLHLFDTLFWPEAQFDYGMFKGDLTETKVFVRDLESGYLRRLHLSGIPVITIAGDEARIDAGSIIKCRTAEPAPGVDETFWGRYLFSAERRNGEWRFSKLTYVLNLYERAERRDDDAAMPVNFGDGLDAAHPFRSLARI
ncbi:nuclear transport factor 2 family protein [Croceicoccus ponticola]|uniref:Nuclear transport factor 2 family protein n=1 Tax=Croceicoccus ponticola TaxID=2217664 RepID=A0A437H1J9_9SPHN|nr:nuclear transport factor 2 family protein [Croceicoccus ponticola]RVQ69505.1 nuclear transport factor 2 family protein [Croceicoccus ponticola]